MDICWFDVEVAGPVTEEHTDALGAGLAAAAGTDASVQAGQLGGTVMFSREADGALVSAALIVRDGLRDLPARDRPLPARLTPACHQLSRRAVMLAAWHR